MTTYMEFRSRISNLRSVGFYHLRHRSDDRFACPSPYKLRISLKRENFESSFPLIFDILQAQDSKFLSEFKVADPDFALLSRSDDRFTQGGQYTLYLQTDPFEFDSQIAYLINYQKTHPRTGSSRYARPFEKPPNSSFLAYGPSCIPNPGKTFELINILEKNLLSSGVEFGIKPESDLKCGNYLSGRFDGTYPLCESRRGYVSESDLGDDQKHAFDFMFYQFLTEVFRRENPNLRAHFQDILESPLMLPQPPGTPNGIVEPNAKGYLFYWQMGLISDDWLKEKIATYKSKISRHFAVSSSAVPISSASSAPSGAASPRSIVPSSTVMPPFHLYLGVLEDETKRLQIQVGSICAFSKGEPNCLELIGAIDVILQNLANMLMYEGSFETQVDEIKKARTLIGALQNMPGRSVAMRNAIQSYIEKTENIL